MEGSTNFVESIIPLWAVKSAIELRHTHENKELLDSLTTDGSSIQYLGGDGKYHDFQESFYVDAFLSKYNQSEGNVVAAKDANDDLYLNATNTFASALDNKVVGSIELERESSKQINVSIAEVDVNSGEITENAIKYITASAGVGLNYEGGILSVGLVKSEEPFSTLMEKQADAVVGNVGVFSVGGSIIDVGAKLSNLVTSNQLKEHADNTNLHTTAELQAGWSAKQHALTTGQLNAVNSGITVFKVAQYDAYGTSKQSVGGNAPNMNLVTDASGNIITEERFVPSTKINTVPTAVQNRVATFTAGGNVADSGITLGAFSSNETVKEYVDTLVNSRISGASYQGTFTFFGTQEQVESVVDVAEGDTALVYSGALNDLEGLLRGTYSDANWTFVDLTPIPTNGAWMETDNLLGNDPIVPGRLILNIDGVNPPALDVRPNTSLPLDYTTIGLNSAGRVSLKMKMLASGKSVMNTVTADGLSYEFTSSGGVDTSKTIREVIENYSESKQDKLVSGSSIKTINDNDILGSGNLVIESGSAVYDQVIKTQAEFEVLLTSPTWHDANSIAFVGNFELSTEGNTGIKVPENVLRIDGFGEQSAQFAVSNFVYSSGNGGIWWDDPVQMRHINNISVGCIGVDGVRLAGFSGNKCVYSNCTGITSGGQGELGSPGFYGDDNIYIDCIGVSLGTDYSSGFVGNDCIYKRCTTDLGGFTASSASLYTIGFAGRDNSYEDCTSNIIQSGGGAAFVAGFMGDTNIHSNCKVTCEFSGDGEGIIAGFYGKDCVYTNCTGRVNGSSNAYGFYGSNLKIMHCEVAASLKTDSALTDDNCVPIYNNSTSSDVYMDVQSCKFTWRSRSGYKNGTMWINLNTVPTMVGTVANNLVDSRFTSEPIINELVYQNNNQFVAGLS